MNHALRTTLTATACLPIAQPVSHTYFSSALHARNLPRKALAMQLAFLATRTTAATTIVVWPGDGEGTAKVNTAGPALGTEGEDSAAAVGASGASGTNLGGGKESTEPCLHAWKVELVLAWACDRDGDGGVVGAGMLEGFVADTADVWLGVVCRYV